MMTVDDAVQIGMALAAFGGLVIAALGLRTWKQQLRGTAEYDLARRLLRAALQVRDEIARLRNRWAVVIAQSEADNASSTAEESKRKGWSPEFERAAYDRAWRSLAAARSNLAVELTEAEVLWGTNARELIEPLDDCIAELSRAVRLHLSESAPWYRMESEDVIRAREAILYDESIDGSDGFAKRIDTAVAKIDSALRPHLRSRRSRFRTK
jgi:hypothetical protein